MTKDLPLGYAQTFKEAWVILAWLAFERVNAERCAADDDLTQEEAQNIIGTVNAQIDDIFDQMKNSEDFLPWIDGMREALWHGNEFDA